MENKVLRVSVLYTLFIYSYYLLWLVVIYIIQDIIGISSMFIYSFWFVFSMFIYKVLYFYSHKYEFENNQLIITKGVFSKTVDYIEFYRVKDYQKYQSFWMRLFQVMTIKIVTSDKISKVLDIKGVRSSNILKDLRPGINQSRLSNRVFEVD